MSTDCNCNGLLTAAEAAEYLGVAEGTVRNWAHQGRLPSVKLGPTRMAALRFRRAELDAWVREQDGARRAAKGETT